MATNLTEAQRKWVDAELDDCQRLVTDAGAVLHSADISPQRRGAMNRKLRVVEDRLESLIAQLKAADAS